MYEAVKGGCVGQHLHAGHSWDMCLSWVSEPHGTVAGKHTLAQSHTHLFPDAIVWVSDFGVAVLCVANESHARFRRRGHSAVCPANGLREAKQT